jgi:TolB-like protein
MGGLLAGILSALVFGAAPQAEEPDGGPTRVVVYNLSADEDLLPLAASLTDELLLHLGRAKDLRVVGESELKVMVQHEQDKVVMECDGAEACLARISEAVKADKIVTGRIGRIGDNLVATVKLADARRRVVERGESASATTKEDLRDELLSAVDRLLGRGGASEAPSFRMAIAPQGTSAAVLDLAAHGVEPGIAQSLTQLLSLELKRFEGLGVISRDEIQTMLRFETDKQVLQCSSDTSCLVEIGGALGVDYLVSGSVGKLGEALVINLKLMDIGEARVVNRASESFQGVESHLPKALRFAAWSLLGKPVEGTGRLSLRTNVDEGKASLDGEAPVNLPLEGPFSGLVPGKHGLALTSEDYHPGFLETYVEPGELAEMPLELRPLPQSWYQKWWVWTLVGTAVAGATTATLLLMEDDPATGTVTVTVE